VGAPTPDNDAHGTRPLRYEQLLVGRKAGVYEPMAAGGGTTHRRQGVRGRGRRRHGACHHAYKRLLVGWFPGANEMRGRPDGMAQTMPIIVWAVFFFLLFLFRFLLLHHNERHQCLPQPHEPLLMGWIAGGRKMKTTSAPAPPQPITTAPPTHCHEPLLVGGKGVLCEKYGGLRG
jgi:hypothetical protein